MWPLSRRLSPCDTSALDIGGMGGVCSAWGLAEWGALMPSDCESGLGRAVRSAARHGSVGRVALVLACALVGLLVVGGLAWGFGAAPYERPLTPEEQAGHDRGIPPDQLAALQERARRERDARDAPSARARREAHQWDLSAVGDEQAQAADARMAPEVFGVPVWHQPSVGGAHVTSFLGDRVARVVSPSGHRGLVVSSVPLHSAAGGQGDKPVDLTVEDRGSMFALANPTVATTVPKQTSGELSLGELRIRPGADRLSTGRVVDGRVLYPNSARDTDVAVAPLPMGVETFTLLRSPAASHSLGLGLGLGAGERLVASDAPGGGFDVVRDDQQRVAHIPQPTATDAAGREVAVHTAISAAGLQLTVDATAKDTAWPVSVDPAVYYDFNNRREAAGWSNYTAGPGWAYWGLQNGAGGWGYGLYTYPAGGWFASAPYSVGEWNYYGEFWRSSTAYVYAAQMGSYFAAGYGACRYAGIFSLNGGWEAGNDGYSNTCATAYGKYDAWCIAPCDPTTTAAQAPNYAVFGTQATVYNANSFVNYLQAANVYIGDHEPPTASASGLPPGWVQDTGYQVTGSDTGVGVNSVSATGAASWSSGCSVDPDNHCPASQTITATTNSLPEGIDNINANATDVIGGAGHTFNGTIGQVKIDRTPPGVSLSGALYADRSILDPQEGTYDYGFITTDESVSVAASDANSGVASVEMNVDHQRLRPEWLTSYACGAAGCPTAQAPSFTLHAGDVPEGDHEVELISRDQLAAPNNTVPDSHTTVSTFTVHIGGTEPPPADPDPNQSAPGPTDPNDQTDSTAPNGGDISSAQAAGAQSVVAADALNPLSDLHSVVGLTGYTVTGVGPLDNAPDPTTGALTASGATMLLTLTAPVTNVDTSLPTYLPLTLGSSTIVPFRVHLHAPSIVTLQVEVDFATNSIINIQPGPGSVYTDWTPLPNQGQIPPDPTVTYGD